MSQTLAQQNTDISQVIAVLCDNDSIARGCGSCAQTQGGLIFVNLLLALQIAYPTNAWTLNKLTSVTEYMRARGIVLIRDGLYYLNYDMVKLGGANEVWAKQCPKVAQPYCCITTQAPKYGSLPPMVEVPLSTVCPGPVLPSCCADQ